MSDLAKDVKFSLKVLINKQKTKVLFAEIDSDLADVLFSFLTLPLGKVVRILKKQYGDKAPVFGSITTLYDGLSNLYSSHFKKEAGKKMLLNPLSSFIDECRRLKLDIGDNQPIKYFTCGNKHCLYPRSKNLAMYFDSFKCDCGEQLKKEIPLRNLPKADGGVFTKKRATFVLSDDLQILPNVTASVRQIVSGLGLMDIDGAEFRNVTFGLNEIMDLLKHSLFSSTPLSNLVLKKQTKCEPVNSFHQIGIFASSYNAKYLKVIFQKSTNKFLFAEAEGDFVEFFFNLLIIPLGGVENILGNNTSLKNIDNLYRSVAFPIDVKYLSLGHRLIWPTIPCGYLSPNRIFSLTEEVAPKLYYNKTSYPKIEEYLTLSGEVNCTLLSPRDHLVNYMKEPGMYMVKDDLTVTPLCMDLYLNTLDEQKIALSDVDEVVLNIGVEEASNILKASLSSTSALSIGLNHLLKKQPKQEK